MGIFGGVASSVSKASKGAKGFTMAPFKAMRRIIRRAFDAVVGIPARVGRTASLGVVSGTLSSTAFGLALMLFVGTYLGVL